MLTQEEKEVVAKAVELISDPEKWTSNASARDKNGDSISFLNRKACRWCAAAAIQKLSNVETSSAIFVEFRKKFQERISIINDNFGREAVIEKLKELAA